MKKLISLLLVMALVFAAFPLAASASTAENIVAYAPQYNADGTALTGISTRFNWSSNKSSVSSAQLVLMSKPLTGSNRENKGWGDFSDAGAIYKLGFKNFDDAKNYQSNKYGLIVASQSTSIGIGEKGKVISLDFSSDPISSTSTQKYYVYLWVYYRGCYYPDNLMCVIQFRNGQLFYTPGVPYGYVDYRNYYADTDTSFKVVENNGENIIPDNGSKNEPIHNHTTLYAWDAAQHWQVTLCSVAGCADNGKKTNISTHKFDNDYDTTCDCGYTRTAPAAKPATGDITNIPLWTALFLGGMALLWFQLEQRRRQQF